MDPEAIRRFLACGFLEFGFGCSYLEYGRGQLPVRAHPEARNRPWSLPGSRGDGSGGYALPASFWLGSTSDAVPCPLCSRSPRSSRPQPLGSRREAAPCEDPKEERGLHFNFAHQVLLQCVVLSVAAKSQQGPTVTSVVTSPMLGARRHSEASDALREHRRVPLAQ